MTALPGVRISVIIPVFNGTATSRDCLRALANSSIPATECLVVDDGSTDGSAAIAEAMGATVLSTGGRYGPARARNLGARRATGDVLLFIDADVAIHADALERIRDSFESDPELDALIGSYDDAPSGSSLVSQFKNLLHAFVHHEGNHQASTFWCGCGAIRRSVYLEHGGLDEAYRSASIEDIEFGARLKLAGRKVELDPGLQCKHLKIWTLWSMVRTDVVERGIPWTRLILRTRVFPNDLNLRWDQRYSAVLSGIFVVLAAAGISGVFARKPSAIPCLAGALAAFVAIGFLNRKFYSFLTRRKGWFFTARAIWLHLLYFLYSAFSFVTGAILFAVAPTREIPPAAGAPIPVSEEEGR